MSYQHPWVRGLSRVLARSAEVDQVAKAVKRSRHPIFVEAPTEEIKQDFLRVYRARHPGLPEPVFEIIGEKGRP